MITNHPIVQQWTKENDVKALADRYLETQAAWQDAMHRRRDIDARMGEIAQAIAAGSKDANLTTEAARLALELHTLADRRVRAARDYIAASNAFGHCLANRARQEADARTDAMNETWHEHAAAMRIVDTRPKPSGWGEADAKARRIRQANAERLQEQRRYAALYRAGLSLQFDRTKERQILRQAQEAA